MRKGNKLDTNKKEAIHKEPKVDGVKNGELGKTSKQVYYVNYYQYLTLRTRAYILCPRSGTVKRQSKQV